MKTGALIVATGLSSRMGSFKPMLRLGEDTAIRRIIKTLMEAGADPMVVITGYNAEILEHHLLDLRVICIKNENYENTQMLDSAKIELEFLRDKCDGLLFTPTDVLLFSLQTVKNLMDCGQTLACPYDSDREGHPLFISSGLIPSLLSFHGGGGLRGAILACGLKPLYIPSDDPVAFLDADTPEEFSKLERLAAKTRTRNIYLIRHRQPRFPKGVSFCLGSQDLPLSGRGITEAMALRSFFRAPCIPVVRLKPNHAEAGAALLSELGYPPLSPAVAAHMQLPEKDGITEKSLVYLADKLVCEDRRVTLEERFSRRLTGAVPEDPIMKCFGRAKELCMEIERITGKPVV